MCGKMWAVLTAGPHISVFNNALNQRAVLENRNTADGMYWVGLLRRFIEDLKVNLVGMRPADELVSGEAWAIARRGHEYIVYLPNGGTTHVAALPSNYRAHWFNPRNGAMQAAEIGPEFSAPDSRDWVLYIKTD